MRPRILAVAAGIIAMLGLAVPGAASASTARPAISSYVWVNESTGDTMRNTVANSWIESNGYDTPLSVAVNCSDGYCEHELPDGTDCIAVANSPDAISNEACSYDSQNETWLITDVGTNGAGDTLYTWTPYNFLLNDCSVGTNFLAGNGSGEALSINCESTGTPVATEEWYEETP